MEPAYVYCRFSPKRGDSCTTIEVQEAACAKYAERAGFRLAGVYYDEGVSASVALHDRDGGRRLIESATAAKGCHIVIYRLDRMFRSTYDLLGQVKRFDKIKAKMHIVDLAGSSIDCSSLTGRFFLTVMAAVAEFEREMIRDRTMQVNRHNRYVKRKYSPNKIPPFGYIVDGDGNMLPDPLQQRGLNMMMYWRSKGITFREIGELMYRDGYHHREMMRHEVHRLYQRTLWEIEMGYWAPESAYNPLIEHGFDDDEELPRKRPERLNPSRLLSCRAEKDIRLRGALTGDRLGRPGRTPSQTVQSGWHCTPHVPLRSIFFPIPKAARAAVTNPIPVMSLSTSSSSAAIAVTIMANPVSAPPMLPRVVFHFGSGSIRHLLKKGIGCILGVLDVFHLSMDMLFAKVQVQMAPGRRHNHC